MTTFVIFIGALVLSLAIIHVVMTWNIRATSVSRHLSVEELTPSQIAILCGGRAHLYPTLWVRLVQGNHLFCSIKGGFIFSPSAYQDPELGHLARAFDSQYAHKSANVRLNYARTQVAETVEEQMSGLGLLTTQLFHQVSLKICMVLALIVPCFIAALITRHYTVGVALGGLFVGAFLGLFSTVLHRYTGSNISRLMTDNGLAMRRQLQEKFSAATRAPMHDTLLMAVAVGGMAALVGTPFEALANVEPEPEREGDGGGDAGISLTFGSDGSSTTSFANDVPGFTTGGFIPGSNGFSGGDGSSGDGGGGCGGGGCGG